MPQLFNFNFRDTIFKLSVIFNTTDSRTPQKSNSQKPYYVISQTSALEVIKLVGDLVDLCIKPLLDYPFLSQRALSMLPFRFSPSVWWVNWTESTDPGQFTDLYYPLEHFPRVRNMLNSPSHLPFFYPSKGTKGPMDLALFPNLYLYQLYLYLNHSK